MTAAAPVSIVSGISIWAARPPAMFQWSVQRGARAARRTPASRPSAAGTRRLTRCSHASRSRGAGRPVATAPGRHPAAGSAPRRRSRQLLQGQAGRSAARPGGRRARRARWRRAARRAVAPRRRPARRPYPASGPGPVLRDGHSAWAGRRTVRRRAGAGPPPPPAAPGCRAVCRAPTNACSELHAAGCRRTASGRRPSWKPLLPGRLLSAPSGMRSTGGLPLIVSLRAAVAVSTPRRPAWPLRCAGQAGHLGEHRCQRGRHVRQVAAVGRVQAHRRLRGQAADRGVGDRAVVRGVVQRRDDHAVRR